VKSLNLFVTADAKGNIDFKLLSLHSLAELKSDGPEETTALPVTNFT